ncbi:MAG: hypothetical protein Q7J29_08605 [Stagnimonas sp.]|nr:hypothetical protein [Stagnimonas sp.]
MKNIVMILVGLALLAGLFWWMKPSPSTAPVAATPAAPDAVAAPVAAPPASPVPQQFDLVVKDKKRVSGPAVISVAQGTPVTLRITVDHHDELHLHGYDLTLKLPTATPTELRFTADKSGRFEYELHHAHLDLGVLEVQPQ